MGLCCLWNPCANIQFQMFWKALPELTNGTQNLIPLDIYVTVAL